MAGNKRAEEQQIKLRYSLIDSKRELLSVSKRIYVEAQ